MLNHLNPSGAWPAGDRASYIVPARELIRFRLGSERVDIHERRLFVEG